jgi:hypothetical protein
MDELFGIGRSRFCRGIPRQIGERCGGRSVESDLAIDHNRERRLPRYLRTLNDVTEVASCRETF